VTLDPKARRHYVKDDILYCPAIPLKKIYGYGVANPVNLHRLSIIKDFDPDIIHLHTEFSMGIFAQFAAKRLKKPVVYTLHTMYDDYVFYLLPQKAPERVKSIAKPLAHSYIRRVAANATEIIGPSRKVVEYLRHCGVKRQVNIIPNTVDVSSFLPENENKEAVQTMREKLDLSEKDVAICFVGRLGKEKSIDVLMEYFAEHFAGKKRFRLIIVGDGPDKEMLQNLAESLNIHEQTTLMGRVDHEEIPNLYRACDLFATASLTEMNSISMLEAMASGLYVVQRLDVFNQDQIQSGVTGETFTNPQEFASIVWKYATYSDEQKARQKETVSNYASRYGTKEFTDEVLRIYNLAVHEYGKKQ
jgi:1,2-diacylglycerol 3-alpha-glucosyltransferase